MCEAPAALLRIQTPLCYLKENKAKYFDFATPTFSFCFHLSTVATFLFKIAIFLIRFRLSSTLGWPQRLLKPGGNRHKGFQIGAFWKQLKRNRCENAPFPSGSVETLKEKTSYTVTCIRVFGRFSFGHRHKCMKNTRYRVKKNAIVLVWTNENKTITLVEAKIFCLESFETKKGSSQTQ